MPCSPDALLPADQTPPKSPRSFAHGTVGLGIVAAMSAAAAESKMIAAPPRSEPIPITSPRPRGAGWKDAGDADEEEELSESYTCVISHVAGSKRVYFDDGSDGVRYNYGASPGVFFQSPPAIKAVEFINRCYLCAKKLHGLDIFMYRRVRVCIQSRCSNRGDKAFCSLECRCRQFLSDEYRENCYSEALEQPEYFTVSPILFSAGVAAA